MVIDHAALVHPGASASHAAGVVNAAALGSSDDELGGGFGVDFGALAGEVNLPPIQGRQLNQSNLAHVALGDLGDLALARLENKVRATVVAQDFEVAIVDGARLVVFFGRRRRLPGVVGRRGGSILPRQRLGAVVLGQRLRRIDGLGYAVAYRVGAGQARQVVEVGGALDLAVGAPDTQAGVKLRYRYDATNRIGGPLRPRDARVAGSPLIVVSQND